MTNLNKTDINDKVKTDIIERSGFLKDCLKTGLRRAALSFQDSRHLGGKIDE